MRTANAIRTALLGAMLVAIPAFSQNPPRSFDPEKMLDSQMSQLKGELSLTADQEQQVRPILKESLEKMVDLRAKARDGSEKPSSEMREERVKLQQDTHDQLAKVLSKEQMEKYEKIQEERRSRFAGGRRGDRNQ